MSGPAATETTPHDVVGLILAGGQGHRLGRRDKALLQLGGTTLVERAVGRLGPQVACLALSANGDPRRFVALGGQVSVLADALPDQGPLAGIAAGLELAQSRGASRIVTVAVDTPFFPGDLVARLTDGQPLDHVAVACDSTGLHPTFALWPVSALPAVQVALGQQRASLRAVIAGIGLAAVRFPETDPPGFFNINTPDDLALAEAMARAVD